MSLIIASLLLLQQCFIYQLNSIFEIVNSKFEIVNSLLEIVKIIFEIVNIILEIVNIIFEIVNSLFEIVKILLEIVNIIFEIVNIISEIVNIIFEIVNILFERIYIIILTYVLSSFMIHIIQQKCFRLQPPFPPLPPLSHQILIKHFLNLIFVHVQSLTFKLYIVSKLLVDSPCILEQE